MEALVPLLVAVPATLACPAMMLWHRRRGSRAACCAPARGPDVAELRVRQAKLRSEIAGLESAEPAQDARSAERSA